MHTLAETARRPRAGRCAPGFTLIELLVALGVILILAMLLLGVVMRVRHLARDSTCKSNLSQMWKALNVYANNADDILFVNYFPPLRISNVVYKEQAVTGWGHLYPAFLPDYRALFCPNDPMRSPQWEYGWDNWETEDGEVQCSYGYRGRQGLVAEATTPLVLSEIDRNRTKIVGCDYYGDVTAPPRHHHEFHINVLRCNGMVEEVKEFPTFGPDDGDFEAAVESLDR